jgi:hypothetical protein
VEKRDAITGSLIKVFTNLDGLPDNFATILESDGNNGLWVGTGFNGLGHLDHLGKWTTFNTGNSELPDNAINDIVSDGNGGVWIATGIPIDEEKLYRLLGQLLQESSNNSSVTSSNSDNANFLSELLIKKLWEVLLSHFDVNLLNDMGLFKFNTNEMSFGNFFNDKERHFNRNLRRQNSVVEIFGEISVNIFSIFGCGKNSFLAKLYDRVKVGEENIFSVLFSGSTGGLVHISSDGQWKIYNTENSGMPNNIITITLNLKTEISKWQLKPHLQVKQQQQVPQLQPLWQPIQLLSL